MGWFDKTMFMFLKWSIAPYFSIRNRTITRSLWRMKIMIIFLILNSTRDLTCVDWKGICNSNPFQDKKEPQHICLRMAKLLRAYMNHLLLKTKTNLKIYLHCFTYTYTFPQVVILKDWIFNLQLDNQLQIQIFHVQENYVALLK